MIDIRYPATQDAAKSAEVLQATLLELQALQLATKQAHWNVAGMLFWPMHEMLDAHYEGIAAMVDTVAERLRAIGSAADGRPRTIVERAPIADMPGGLLDDTWVLPYFTEQYAAVAARLRERIGEIEEHDPTSANLLQEVEHLVEKDQWQMRAHLESAMAEPGVTTDTGKARRSSPSRAVAHGVGARA